MKRQDERGIEGIRRGGLALTVGSHVWHAGILHHCCRITGHHLRICARIETSLRTHAGELLLLVVHHLLTSRLTSRLLWGLVVEVGSTIVAKAIVGVIHGCVSRRSKSRSRPDLGSGRAWEQGGRAGGGGRREALDVYGCERERGL